MALIEVRSVYDTDGLGRMGDAMLTAADLPAGCTTRHRADRADRPDSTRARRSPTCVRMKDPADPAYQLRAGALRARDRVPWRRRRT